VVTINNIEYRVIREDSESVPTFPNGNQQNRNHAEKKIYSYLQDTYSGERIQVDLAVQNNSASAPGMCAGCQASAPAFAHENPGFTINIYEGSSNVNP
jgi:hypothetical protein